AVPGARTRPLCAPPAPPRSKRPLHRGRHGVGPRPGHAAPRSRRHVVRRVRVPRGHPRDLVRPRERSGDRAPAIHARVGRARRQGRGRTSHSAVRIPHDRESGPDTRDHDPRLWRGDDALQRVLPAGRRRLPARGPHPQLHGLKADPALIPGLLLAALLGAAALWLADLPWIRDHLHWSALLLVILLGMAWKTLAPVPAATQPGVRFAQRPVLRWAV